MYPHRLSPSSLKPVIAAAALGLPMQAAAQRMDSMQVASELGTLLASETYCGLSYDPSAIETYVDTHVDPTDMGFAGTLNMVVRGTQYQLEDQSPSAKTAHCRVIARTAKHYGFVE